MNLGCASHECANGAHGLLHRVALAMDVLGGLVGVELEEPVVVVLAAVSRVDLETSFFVAGFDHVGQRGLESFVLTFGARELCNE